MPPDEGNKGYLNKAIHFLGSFFSPEMLDKHLDSTIEAMLYEAHPQSGRKFDSINMAYIYLARVLNSVCQCFDNDKAQKQFFIVGFEIISNVESPILFLVYAFTFLFASYKDRFGYYSQEFKSNLLSSIRFDPRMLMAFQDEIE